MAQRISRSKFGYKAFFSVVVSLLAIFVISQFRYLRLVEEEEEEEDMEENVVKDVMTKRTNSLISKCMN